MAEKNPNWGGARTGAGRPRRYSWTQISEWHAIQDTDLQVCIACEDDRRGIVVRDPINKPVWYGENEARGISAFVQEYL